jgi:hypothetical protein
VYFYPITTIHGFSSSSTREMVFNYEEIVEAICILDRSHLLKVMMKL